MEPFDKSYRIIWNDDFQYMAWEAPLTPEQFAHVILGQVAGSQVDAVFPTVCMGYSTIYPSALPEVEYYGEKWGSDSSTKINTVWQWRLLRTIKSLIESGHDPLEIYCRESRRLGLDIFPDMHQNDWHHRGESGGEEVWNPLAGSFYRNHPEFKIGAEAEGAMEHFQDFAHPEVREFRRSIAEEVCRQYDVDGFQLDFMRIPGFFKPSEVEQNTPLMTQYLRDVRATLDRVGNEKSRRLGLAVRTPLTIERALDYGLDIKTWIAEGLVDILCPTPFFMNYMDADISPFTELARDSDCRIYPLIEESYKCGYARWPGMPGWIYGGRSMGDVIQPISIEMARAVAMNYWRAGADGISLYNWEGIYGQDYLIHPALDEIGEARGLTFKDKRYAVTRSDASDGSAHSPPAPLPVALGEEAATFSLRVSDDLEAAGERVEAITLWLYIKGYTSQDEIEVALNGAPLTQQLNPLEAGMFAPPSEAIWVQYDLRCQLPRLGANELSVRLVRRNPDLTPEFAQFDFDGKDWWGSPITGMAVTDVEVEIRYGWPHGDWRPPRGWMPRS